MKFFYPATPHKIHQNEHQCKRCNFQAESQKLYASLNSNYLNEIDFLLEAR